MNDICIKCSRVMILAEQGARNHNCLGVHKCRPKPERIINLLGDNK